MTLTDQVQSAIRAHFAKGERRLGFAVDATCGNGFDTLFLAVTMGFEKVYAFDIQTNAIQITQSKLQRLNLKTVFLYQHDHAILADYVDQKIDCFMYNLGYLPGSDKSITTEATTTLKSLEFALTQLTDTGIVSIVCYPGHSAGSAETTAIKTWLGKLDSAWDITRLDSENASTTTPIGVLIRHSD